MEQFESHRKDIDVKAPSKICCCIFDRNKWTLLWYWLTAKRAFQSGNYEYRIPVPPFDYEEEQEDIAMFRQQTSFWGSRGPQAGDYSADLNRSKNREARIQSYGRLTFDQYCLIASKVQNNK
eukprot:Blabericola_migrator_1__2154@NODE_1595_length_4207_cov_18_682367_g1043_i0_p5_GENE_NODE_1595_length_4207_cov_18_682367_g1043_i0NODE_1595_length_4207_cov_18_682367_g1043_i0_p5_ORF_typecomplete_len122_score19_96_NODE_1595_length_4207_cov_18_682367_g1043_i012851650